MNFADLRAELPLTKKVAYFQTGSAGPTPDSVTQLVSDTLFSISHNGLSVPDAREKLNDQEAQAKKKLARFLGADANELAWMPNTSQAMHKVLHAMRWRPGDEFIVTSAEHVSVQGACQTVEKIYGVNVITIPAFNGDAALLDALKQSVTSRTRLICVSDVSTMDGRRLPLAQCVKIAHEHGVPVLADVAQSVGQIPVNLHAIGCDYAIGSIHKWMLGTKGLGFLYVDKARIADFVPDLIPDYHPWTDMSGSLPPIDAASRADQGTYDYAIRIGVGRTIDILNGIGIEEIAAHCQRLSAHFCHEVRDWPGVNIVSSLEQNHLTGLCCINFDRLDEPEVRGLVNKLINERLIVKYQPEPNGIRLSFAPFNKLDEVERLLNHLKRHLDF